MGLKGWLRSAGQHSQLHDHGGPTNHGESIEMKLGVGKTYMRARPKTKFYSEYALTSLSGVLDKGECGVSINGSAVDEGVRDAWEDAVHFIVRAVPKALPHRGKQIPGRRSSVLNRVASFDLLDPPCRSVTWFSSFV